MKLGAAHQTQLSERLLLAAQRARKSGARASVDPQNAAGPGRRRQMERSSVVGNHQVRLKGHGRQLHQAGLTTEIKH